MRQAFVIAQCAPGARMAKSLARGQMDEQQKALDSNYETVAKTDPGLSHMSRLF